jgi:hypothetical protein
MPSSNLDRIPAVIALMTSLCIVLGILHNVGFFSVVGLKYLMLLTLEDHVAASISWTPWVLIGLSFTFMQQLDSFFAPKNMKAPEPGFALWCLFSLGVLIGIYSFLFEYEWILYMACVGFIWPLYARTTIERSKLISDRPGLGLSATWSVFLVGWSIVSGHDKAHDMIVGKGPSTETIKVRNSSARQVVLVQYIDRGVLTFDGDSKIIEFVPWDEIRGISQSIEFYGESRACRWFGVLCVGSSEAELLHGRRERGREG